MKKVILLLSILFLITGCDIVKVEQSTIDDIVETVLKKDTKLYNSIFNGYKFYTPQGLSIKNKNDYNILILDRLAKYYLYVDIVGYFNKVDEEYIVKNDYVLSQKIQYKEKYGYAEIKEEENKYYIKVKYNYAKIETIVDKSHVKEAFINICYILSSISYNDKVLDTLIGENILMFKEEKFDLFESKREVGTFLDYDYEYVDKNNELPDEEQIEIGNE